MKMKKENKNSANDIDARLWSWRKNQKRQNLSSDLDGERKKKYSAYHLDVKRKKETKPQWPVRKNEIRNRHSFNLFYR